MVHNVVSIDLEEWYHRPVVKPYLKGEITSTLDDSVKQILDVFSKYGKRSTFFVLGEIVEQFPHIIEEIADRGHEVAYHGYSHQSLNDMNEKTFNFDLEKGVELIKKVSGSKPVGFRAPVFSLNPETRWALECLIKNGFKYDSSIVPARSPMYGSAKAPREIYYPRFNDIYNKSEEQRLLVEFPLTVIRILGVNLPFAGGFYERVFGPELFLRNVVRVNKRNQPAMLYFHPWELCGFPSIDMPFHKKLFAYYNTECIGELSHIVRNLDVAPARDVLAEMNFIRD